MSVDSADALLKTLIANGLEVVFANPGTSEMHLSAIDHHPEVRPVLGLFEGVSLVLLTAMRECLVKLPPIYSI